MEHATAAVKTLPAAHDDELIKELVGYLKKNDATQTETAKRLGVSPATLNSWLQGKYPGKVAELERAIRDFLAREAERSEIEGVSEFLDTAQARDVFGILEFCHLRRRMGVIYGISGVGKTSAVKAYQKQNSGVIYINTDPTTASAAPLMRKIVKTLGIPVSPKEPVDQLKEAVIDHLKGRDALLIIDEAQNLYRDALEVVRTVFDESGIGVVFCGMERVYKQMQGDNTEIFAQLRSRVVAKRRLSPRVSRADTDKFIQRYFPQASSKIMELLNQKANNGGKKGSLRWLDQVLTLVKSQGGDLTGEAIKAAEDILMGED